MTSSGRSGGLLERCVVQQPDEPEPHRARRGDARHLGDLVGEGRWDRAEGGDRRRRHDVVGLHRVGDGVVEGGLERGRDDRDDDDQASRRSSAQPQSTLSAWGCVRRSRRPARPSSPPRRREQPGEEPADGCSDQRTEDRGDRQQDRGGTDADQDQRVGSARRPGRAPISSDAAEQQHPAPELAGERQLRVCRWATSDIAAMGGILEDRSAGMNAESTVTTTPIDHRGHHRSHRQAGDRARRR